MSMVLKRLTTVIILCLLPQVLFSAPKSTQGQFAVKLVEKLGLAKKVSEEKAVEILTSRSIYPGSPFKVQWDKDKEATEKFIAQIQASLQVLLKTVAMGPRYTKPKLTVLWPIRDRGPLEAKISETPCISALFRVKTSACAIRSIACCEREGRALQIMTFNRSSIGEYCSVLSLGNRLKTPCLTKRSSFS